VKITLNSATAALPAQMAEVTIDPCPISLPELPEVPEMPTIPQGVLDLGQSFGNLLANVEGVVKLVDQLAEVKHAYGHVAQPQQLTSSYFRSIPLRKRRGLSSRLCTT
jgi:hypothetical protein